ncbi:hypothetical protein [Desulforamulus hydrothermalis]|nr:hypothetical protein [Desulforamulus hydrothermalis]SHH37080.1 hypothetical protein SAMN02745177_02324 [Desulforamulus hydrothermalis Lam5 = DSM 18033]
MEGRRTRLDIAREKLTQEVYIELKSQGLKDTEIIKQLGIATDVFYKLKKKFDLSKLSQQDKPVQVSTAEIVWIDKRPGASNNSEPLVIIGKRFVVNAAARELLGSNGVKIGVMKQKVVLAPCDGENCYKVSGKKSASIGGNGLIKSLLGLGLTEGTYRISKDDNGYLVGCKEVSNGNTL